MISEQAHQHLNINETPDPCYTEPEKTNARGAYDQNTFICHGNICRSPMAEYVMKYLLKKEGLDSDFCIESAAISREEIGNPVYPPAKRKLTELGISCEGHSARQFTNSDYDKYDLLIGMDQANLRNMYRICVGDYAEKMHLLMDYTDHPRDVSDPWYTGDFNATLHDVEVGCRGILKKLMEEV